MSKRVLPERYAVQKALAVHAHFVGCTTVGSLLALTSMAVVRKQAQVAIKSLGGRVVLPTLTFRTMVRLSAIAFAKQ